MLRTNELLFSAAIGLLLIFMLASCKPHQVITKNDHSEVTTTTIKDSSAVLPEEKISDTLSLDYLIGKNSNVELFPEIVPLPVDNPGPSLPRRKTGKIYSKTQDNLTIKYWRDKYNNLIIECTKKAQEVKIPIKETKTTIKDDKVFKEEPSWFQSIFASVKKFFLEIIAIFIVLLFAYFLLKKWLFK